MATVLAVETSADACSVALLCDGEMIEQHELLPRSHTLHILPMIHAILAEGGIALQSVDAIAFGRGPGSFTGLRVCASVVQGLSYAADIPCAPVSSLQALAKTALDAGLCRESGEILCSVDARMGELYCGRFLVQNDFPSLCGEEFLCTFEALDWPHSAACRVGSGWLHADKIGFKGIVDDSGLLPRASAVAHLGGQLLTAGQVVAADQALPVYLRDDVAWR